MTITHNQDILLDHHGYVHPSYRLEAFKHIFPHEHNRRPHSITLFWKYNNSPQRICFVCHNEKLLLETTDLDKAKQQFANPFIILEP